MTADGLVENDESFRLLMTSTDSAVMFGIAEVDIRLVDSEGDKTMFQ